MALNLLNLGDELKKFIQQNPTPVGYVNKQFQQNVAQPFAQGLKQAGQAYVNAVPAAIKLSPPGQLVNAYQNYKTQANPIQNLKTQVTNVAKAAPLMFAPAGVANIAKGGVLGLAKTALPSALLGGGLSKATGGSFFQGAGQGIGASPQIAGVTQFSNPLINNLTQKVSGKVANPLLKDFTGRVANGLFNLPEGAVVNAALGRPGYGAMDAAIDFGTGFLKIGGGKSGALKMVGEKMTPEQVRVTVDFLTEYENLKREPYSLGQSGRLSELESWLRDMAGMTIDKKFAKNAKIEDVAQELFNVIGYDTDPNFVKQQKTIIDPPIQEAKKYKTTVNLQDKNDLDYLERIFSKDTINDILAGKKTNWRGESYEDLARVNFISETPKTIEQQLSGKIKDVKLKSNTFYHGTNSDAADNIIKSGFKRGSDLPIDAVRGGGYGKMQSSISLAETPKEASIFSTLTPNGKIVEAKLKDNARVVSIDGVQDAVDLEDYIKYLRKQKVDAVYIGGGEKELVVLNPKSVTPIKSQTSDLWNKSQSSKTTPRENLSGSMGIVGNKQSRVTAPKVEPPEDIARILKKIDDGEMVPPRSYARAMQWEEQARRATAQSGVTTKAQMPQQRTQLGTTPQEASVALRQSATDIKPQPELPVGQTKNIPTQQNQPLEDIISQGRKQIKTGGGKEDKRSIGQAVKDVYTQWVDRYNPIVQASRKTKNSLKIKGAELRPEYDPEYLVRRLTGAGGIADTRFRQELEPIIKRLDELKIDKLDFDTYMANRRIAGFGTANREIYGADPAKAKQIVQALETKYGPEISGMADQFYQYQNKGFQEMVDAGFISPEAAKTIRSQNPDYSPLYRAMDEVNDYLGLPTRKTMQGTQPIARIKGSTRAIESPIESIIGNTFSQRAAIEKNRVAKSIVDLQSITDLGFSKAKESGGDTITVWRNGQKEYWKVGQEIANVAKGTNEESMNMILKIIQKPASLLRQGATGRNPEFMLPNIVRDQLDAGITSKYGYIPFVDYVSGLKSMLTNDDIYKKWERSGAKIDLGELSGKKSIAKYFDEKTHKKNLAGWLGAGLDIMGKYSEQPTRVGLFKKAYQKTGNEMLSMMESRDATVDFARMGSKMKTANSIIPFLNVGVQGFDKLIRSVKNNPGRVAVMMGIYGAGPQIASTLYNVTNYPEEYQEIPQYEKDSNFILIKGRTEKGTVEYIKIPKGNVLPVVANPVQSFLDYAYQTDAQSFGEMATNLLSETLPVLSAGSSLKEVAVKTIGSNLPQAIKPLAENLLNKSFYKYDAKKEQSKDIVPYYLQNRPAYMQKYDFTPQMYQKIGAVLNVSPLQVQNLMEGYLAGYTKIPAQVTEMLYKSSRGESINTNDKTLLRRFVSETYPSNSAPPAKKPQAPGIMERITGKTKAAETQDKPLEDWQIQDEKYKLKSSKEKFSQVGSTIFYKKDNGDVGTADLSFQPIPPKLTGQTELDKKAVSKFNGEITSKANDIYDLYKAGKLTEQEAEKALTDLKALKSSYGSGGKLKKITFSKVTAKPIKIALPKARKMASIKLSRPPKPKLAKLKKMKAIVVKPIKVAKLKGLSVGTKLV